MHIHCMQYAYPALHTLGGYLIWVLAGVSKVPIPVSTPLESHILRYQYVPPDLRKRMIQGVNLRKGVVRIQLAGAMFSSSATHTPQSRPHLIHGGRRNPMGVGLRVTPDHHRNRCDHPLERENSQA